MPNAEDSGTVLCSRAQKRSSSMRGEGSSRNEGPSWLYTPCMRANTPSSATSAAYSARLPPFEWPPTTSGPDSADATPDR